MIQTVQICYSDNTTKHIEVLRPTFRFNEVGRVAYVDNGDIYCNDGGDSVTVYRIDGSIERYLNKPSLKYYIDNIWQRTGDYIQFRSDGSVYWRSAGTCYVWKTD